MSRYRTPTAYVLGVLVLLTVIVLTTPNGGTHARWSVTGRAEVPTMTAGRVGFAVGGVESSATLTNTSGLGLRHRPLQVVTQVEAASLGDGTWSTTRSWTVPFTVELPDGTEPPVLAPAVPVVQDAAQSGAALFGYAL